MRGCRSWSPRPKAAAVAVWLDLPENAATRARFLEKYRAWRAALGDSIEAVIAGYHSPERAVIFGKYISVKALCPLNHEGDCTVYPVRPALCRKAAVVGTSEQCNDLNGMVQTIKDPELDATYDGQDSVRTALHSAMRSVAEPELLPKAVMRRLVRGSAAPNQPCPCGSGIKYKHCCRRE